MVVQLPRWCTGQEVVEAFKFATTFQEGLERKWEPHEFDREFQYEPGSVRQTIRRMGVRVWPFSLEKEWVLFGKKVWMRDFDVEFTLTPLVLSNRFDEVEVVVEYNDIWGVTITDPHSPNFDPIRPQFERILGDFYVRLQRPA